MRNCLGEYGVLFGSDGLPVKWSFIEGLHDQQLHDNLFLAYKLSARHIDFTKKQMSVKLAAETLSTSVADAIEYLREDKKIPEFEGNEATCKFISIIDKRLDICNSGDIQKHQYLREIFHKRLQI